MKVIFLDIDGVLNSRRTCYAFKCFGRPGLDGQYFLDEVALKMIEVLCEKTGAKIVISSSWRIGSSLEELQNIFDSYNIKVEVVDKTPQDWSIGSVRGDEIETWLKLHPEVTKYVIIDDDGDMLSHQRANFVQTDCEVGLDFNDVQECERILNE